MTHLEMSIWLRNHLTKLDYGVRDLEQAVMLSGELGQDVQRGLCHIRERLEDVARLVRC
jgi:hypothetical protein